MEIFFYVIFRFPTIENMFGSCSFFPLMMEPSGKCHHGGRQKHGTEKASRGWGVGQLGTMQQELLKWACLIRLTDANLPKGTNKRMDACNERTDSGNE